MTHNPIKDARVLFEDHLDLTTRVQRYVSADGLYPGQPPLTYLHPIAQTDMLVYAGVFGCVWETLLSNFAKYYDPKEPKAFRHLHQMTVPDTGSDPAYMPHNAYLERNAQGNMERVEVDTLEAMRELCRTLRNGFMHFNFRYLSETPREYFKRVKKSLPAGLVDVDTKDRGYRIFVFDGSMDRMLDVGFAHLRWHLHAFLNAFFHTHDGMPLREIYEWESRGGKG